MKRQVLKISFVLALLVGGGIFAYNQFFSCCGTVETTSGCTPSNCRGAQTKFGEAVVITDLRMQLIDLKADMEKYEEIKFPERTYSIHGIVGDSDEESLEIITKEVKLIETEFAELFDLDLEALNESDNKAQLVSALSKRIEQFHQVL